MATNIAFTQPNPVCVVAKLTTDNLPGAAWVICSVPGGTPRFTLYDPTIPANVGSTTSIVGAPQCDNMRDFKAFVTKRFGD